jgi:hypothetical protein
VQCLETVIGETIRFIDQIDRRISIDIIGGGRISGTFHIDGDLQTLVAEGGSIQANLAASRVNDIRSSRDASSGRGGDISGVIDVQSLDQMTSTGSTITATLTTHDPVHPGPIIEALTQGD